MTEIQRQWSSHPCFSSQLAMATDKKRTPLEEKKPKTLVFNLCDANEFQIEITGTMAEGDAFWDLMNPR